MVGISLATDSLISLEEEFVSYGDPAYRAHCLSAASAIPIKEAAESQFPLRCEAEALR